MTINERIRELRTTLELSQPEFGKAIGLSQSSLTMIETGNRKVTDRTINYICMAYEVSEKWLRTGEGKMFNDLERDAEIANYIGAVLSTEDDSFQKRLISALINMSIEEWEVLEKLVTRLAQNEENKKESE